MKAKLAILVVLSCLCGAVQAQTKIKMTLDWRFEGQTSFMWLGLQRGYFQKEGLDVQVDAGSGSTAAIQRIHTGAYDMGLGDMSALIEYYGNNPGQTRLQMVYLQYDEAPLAFLWRFDGVNGGDRPLGRREGAEVARDEIERGGLVEVADQERRRVVRVVEHVVELPQALGRDALDVALPADRRMVVRVLAKRRRERVLVEDLKG